MYIDSCMLCAFVNQSGPLGLINLHSFGLRYLPLYPEEAARMTGGLPERLYREQ